MHANHLLWIVSLFATVTGQTITSQASDVTIEEGYDATFSWTVNDPENGPVIISRPMINEILFFDTDPVEGLDPEKYALTVDGEVMTLTVKNGQTQDGGIYQCQLVLHGVKGQASLVVIRKPMITVTDGLVADDNAIITCECDYGSAAVNYVPGGQMPKVDTYIGDQRQTDVVLELLEGTEGDATKWSTIKQKVNITVDSTHHEIQVKCEAFTETPQFTLSATKALDVQFGAKDVEIVPNNEVYYVGQTLNCSAAGNPEPSFKWVATDPDDTRSIGGKILIIDESLLGDNDWTCLASNFPDGMPYEVNKPIMFTVVQGEPPEEEEQVKKSNDSLVIALAVVIPIAVLVIGGIVGIFFYTRMRMKKKTSNKPSAPGGTGTNSNDANLEPITEHDPKRRQSYENKQTLDDEEEAPRLDTKPPLEDFAENENEINKPAVLPVTYDTPHYPPQPSPRNMRIEAPDTSV